jgi:hypothetical protein
MIDKRHSRLGIASVVIAIVVPVLIICLIIIGAILDRPASSLGKYIVESGFAVGFFAPLLHLTGLVLGVAGWVSKRTKNLFAIIGTALNSILLFIGFLLIVLIISNLSFGFH